MNIKAIGNKVIVRREEVEVKAKSGIILSNGNERGGNAWGVIVSLPEVSDNIWIKTMKIGDRILYKRFQADQALSAGGDGDFEVVDVETPDGSRPGQVLAIEHQ